MSVEIHFEPEPGSDSAMPQLAPPRPFIRAALALVAAAFALAIASSQFGVGKSADIYENAVASRSLSFTDASDGGILVHDAVDGSLALTLPKGTNGFLRGALRSLASTRRRAHMSSAAPFTLTAWGDGRVSIEDPLTGQRIAVTSFGPTQVKSFVALLDPAGKVFPPTTPEAALVIGATPR
jgi:putative photosynthetic complex assembly protein